MKTSDDNLAPDYILRAGLDTLKWACVFARNASYDENCSVKMINDLMDAIHDIPSQLATWTPDRIDTLRLHLRCFDSTKYSGAPNMSDFFEARLDEYKNSA